MQLIAMTDPNNYILEESIGYLTGRTKREITRYLNRKLYEAGGEITTEQLRLLLLLWQDSVSNQQELADLYGKDKTSIARMLQTMEKEGWIVRKPKEDDKRNNQLLITEAGLAIKTRYLPLIAEVLNEAGSAVKEADLEQCKTTLRAIIGHLDQLNSAACRHPKPTSNSKPKKA